MPFRLSLLFAVRPDRLMQQVNKHRLAASHTERLFIVHLQNFYPFSLTLSLFIVRVSFLLSSFVVCLSSRVLEKLKGTAHLRDLNIDLLHLNIRCDAVYSGKMLPTFRRRRCLHLLIGGRMQHVPPPHSHVATRLHAVLI